MVQTSVSIPPEIEFIETVVDVETNDDSPNEEPVINKAELFKKELFIFKLKLMIVFFLGLILVANFVTVLIHILNSNFFDNSGKIAAELILISIFLIFIVFYFWNVNRLVQNYLNSKTHNDDDDDENL